MEAALYENGVPGASSFFGKIEVGRWFCNASNRPSICSFLLCEYESKKGPTRRTDEALEMPKAIN